MLALDVQSAAAHLGVSSATVRNWVKSGMLSTPTAGILRQADVFALREKIQSGEIPRLRKRANKRQSSSRFIPEELASNEELVSELEKLCQFITRARLGVSEAMLTITLKILWTRGELAYSAGTDVLNMTSFCSWKRESVRREISHWLSSLGGRIKQAKARALFELCTPPPVEDFPGILFQSLQQEGHKSRKGSYYTPDRLIDEALDGLRPTAGDFLDPCCGTGKVLLRALRSGRFRMDQLHGIEREELPWRIARLNLLLALSELEFEPSVLRGDSLLDIANGTSACGTNALLNRFSVVLTNPPWGSSLEKEQALVLRERFPQISSGESFSYFTSKCLAFAAREGQVVLFLPDAVLNIGAHKDIRRHILKTAGVVSITQLGRCFSGVFTPVVRMQLRKGAEQPEPTLIVTEAGQRTLVEPCRFAANEESSFDIVTSVQDSLLLEKIFARPYLRLKDKADWALGIVTGDNKRHVLKEAVAGSEPVLRGADIAPYRILKPRRYIVFEPGKFHQVAPERFYRTREKIVYKFISNRLVFAYDGSGGLTLNSANILIPRLAPYSTKALVGLLNSSVLQFVHAKRFRTHKILRGHLEQLPLPLLPAEARRLIEDLVEQGSRGADVRSAIDQIVFDAYGFCEDERAFILLSSDDFNHRDTEVTE